MLPRMRIIQVGDVHLPTAAQAPPALDDKDKRFPVELQTLIASRPTKIVFQSLYRLMEKEEVMAVLFMGDLTDVGDLSGYKACAKFIANALQLGTGGKFSTLPVGIVPGNHDIARELATKVGATTKFEPLALALTTAGLPQLPIAKPIWLDVQRLNARAKIALMNSCWGCGSKEFIPAEFREAVSEAIDAAIRNGNPERETRAYYDRQFDTPAFDNVAIQSLIEGCTEETESLIIACAHHNLLPQRQPRLAPYTELVNSGALRAALQNLDRPVLYLHGHIHDDPIETLIGSHGGSLTCISAPEATDGFNVLDIVFTHTGWPLNCYVRKWRFDQAGIFRETDKVVVSLIGQRRRSSDDTLAKIYSHLLSKNEMYWTALLTDSYNIFDSDHEQKLEEALELLASDGRVQIENHDLARSSWIVGARI